MTDRERSKRWTQQFRVFDDLGNSMPATKIGAVMVLLPEILELQRQGHKIKAICEGLRNDGLPISYETFRACVRRARRKVNRDQPLPHIRLRPEANSVEKGAPMMTGEARINNAVGNTDVFAGIRRSREQQARESFEYDPLASLKQDLTR